ncbi:MAG: acyltransferase [Nitrospinota bacterium]
MKLRTVFFRFFIPTFVVTIYYAIRFRAKVSLRSEVELSSFITLGEKTSIGSFSKVKASDGPLTIGRNVAISNGCSIFSHGEGIKIGDDCLISPNVSLISTNYIYSDLNRPIRVQGSRSRGIIVKNNVWVGTGVVILDGAHIGSGTIIAPNSVVSTKIPDNVIVQGNPAKVIFTRR